MPDKNWLRDLGRRRVSAFFFALLLVAIFEQAISESDKFLHAVDDYVDIIVAIIALLIIFAWWKKNSASDLKKTNNWMAGLALIVIIATIFAMTQEFGDAEDFGNEIPTLLFGIFLLINRFV
jgi:glycerol uptake facilitator-like aquaporin